MEHITDLTNELGKAFETLKADRSYVAQASELANIAGKIINAQKIQMEYSLIRKEKPEINFLAIKTK